jgi:DnaJ-class molecular chaperone
VRAVTAPDDTAHDPQRCTACRGTGTVTSGLGGEPKPVPCPWCDGTGRFIPGHDAQAAKLSG